MIKVTSIPYKKYTKYASKGLTAKKKVLANVRRRRPTVDAAANNKKAQISKPMASNQ